MTNIATKTLDDCPQNYKFELDEIFEAHPGLPEYLLYLISKTERTYELASEKKSGVSDYSCKNLVSIINTIAFKVIKYHPVIIERKISPFMKITFNINDYQALCKLADFLCEKSSLRIRIENYKILREKISEYQNASQVIEA